MNLDDHQQCSSVRSLVAFALPVPAVLCGDQERDTGGSDSCEGGCPLADCAPLSNVAEDAGEHED